MGTSELEKNQDHNNNMQIDIRNDSPEQSEDENER